MTSKDIKPVIEQPATEIPLMLAQAIIVAGVLAIGEIACSPLYFTLMDHSLALVPWALEAAIPCRGVHLRCGLRIVVVRRNRSLSNSRNDSARSAMRR